MAITIIIFPVFFVGILQGLDALGCGQQTDELDGARVGFLDAADGRHCRVSGGQHRVDGDHVTPAHVRRHLEVVLDGLQRFGIAVQPDVTHPGAGHDAEKAVQNAAAGPQD